MDRKRRRPDLDSDSSEDEESSGKRKQLDSDNDSSDSEDENDGTWTENGTEKKIKKKKKPKGKVSDSESNDSDSGDQFDDGFDSDLMGDEEDRAQLEEMTEAQREKILYERTERREAMKKRWEIEKKIRERAKQERQKAAQDSDSDSDDANNSVLLEGNSRRERLDKNKKTDTLDRLKEERKRKEAKRQKDDEKKAMAVGDVFSSDESDDDDGGRMKRYIGNSSDSSSDDERRRDSSDDEGPRRKRDQDDDPEAQKRREKISTKDDLMPAKVSRLRLSQWLHMPWFQNTIAGCYVRVNVGGIYRIAEIAEVTESSKIYSLDGGDGGPRSQTNKALKLKIGEKPRDFRFAFVSNTPWTDTEFAFWKKQMERCGCNLPTNGQIATKAKKLEQARKHVITDTEIEKMVREKEKYRSAPVNFATKKTTLIKLRDAAETEGNIDQVARIQQELEKLEERANMLNRERQKDISGITYINDRIKAKLKERDAIGAKEWKEFNEKKVDPFTRRTTAPIMVSNTNPETKGMIKDVLAERYTEDIDMRYEELVFVKEKDPEKNKPKKTVDNSSEDLYGVHDFDLDIEIDI